MTAPLLEIEDLHVEFVGRRGRPVRAVDGVDLTVGAGETVGLVGESGCGKSVTSLAVIDLLPRREARVSGRISFDGRDLRTVGDREMRAIRGRDIAMVFQDPMTSLNPVLTIGRQITEVLRRHLGLGRAEARREAIRLLDSVEIPDAERRLGDYPHQLSGGMRQRALIAMALACRPRLLIADEPTTALDVTIQAQILGLLKALVVDSGTALVLITHDLGVVAGTCETVHVMYHGRIVESAGRRPLFAEPRHPYTAGLLASVPRLDAPRGQPLHPIAGSPRDTIDWTEGCSFAPRCPRRLDACLDDAPPLERDDDRSFRCIHPVPIPERMP